MAYVNKLASPETKSDELAPKNSRAPLFTDNRSSAVSQRNLQQLMQNSMPVQAVWQWEQFGKNPGKWRWVKPHTVGNKDEIPGHQGQTHGEKYPAAEVVDVSAQYKQEQIAQYLSLIPHLKGELEGKNNVKGGHVWEMMRAEWGDRLSLVAGEQNADAPWQCTWTIDTRTAKGSTMFPSNWDEERLTSELRNSSMISGKLYVSGIKIKKAGNTFYPDV